MTLATDRRWYGYVRTVARYCKTHRRSLGDQAFYAGIAVDSCASAPNLIDTEDFAICVIAILQDFHEMTPARPGERYWTGPGRDVVHAARQLAKLLAHARRASYPCPE